MKKTAITVTLILAFLFSALTGTQFIDLGNANPYMYHEYVSAPLGSKPLVISLFSPLNNSIYKVNEVTLAFNISTQFTSLNYLLGAYYEADWMPDNVTVYKQNTRSPEFPTDWTYTRTFNHLPDGDYSIVITAWGGGFYARGLTAYNFDMTTISVVNFTIDSEIPKISVLSPESKTYNSSAIQLNYTISEKASVIKYSLDAQDNLTLYENTNLTGLPNGMHNLTIYAWDLTGNLGSSETTYFNVQLPEPEPEPFLVVPIAAASAAVAVAAGAGFFVYFKKRKRQS